MQPTVLSTPPAPVLHGVPQRKPEKLVDFRKGLSSMRKLLAFALKAAISAGLLYLAFRRVNFQVVSQRLHDIEYVWFATAVLILLAQTILGALRWHVIVQHCDPAKAAPFTIPNALRYTFIAAFFNQTLPSTVGGDAVRIWLLGRDQNGWRMATYSVLIDRIAGVMVLALLVVLCLPWSFALIGSVSGRLALLLIGFGSIGAGLAFLALGFVRWPWLDRWWLSRQLADAAVIARYVFTSTSSRVIILAYSLLIHVISVSAAWCLAQAIAAPLEWTQALLLVLPVLLISTIPLSIAGWGTRESAMVLAFGYAGLLESNGLVVSMLFGIAAFAAGLVGGFVWILDRGRQFRDSRQVAR